MGGFSLVMNGVETVLDYESFFKLLKIKTVPNFRSRPIFQEPFEIAFPTITAAEIQDKARGDFLSKAIVILQSLWFIVQCMARGKQGLALTELELVTLALASLNGVMYYFWWDKPLGIKEPIKVYPSSVDPPKKVVYGAGRLVSITIQLNVSGVQVSYRAAFGLPRSVASFRDSSSVPFIAVNHLSLDPFIIYVQHLFGIEPNFLPSTIRDCRGLPRGFRSL